MTGHVSISWLSTRKHRNESCRHEGEQHRLLGRLCSESGVDVVVHCVEGVIHDDLILVLGELVLELREMTQELSDLEVLQEAHIGSDLPSVICLHRLNIFCVSPDIGVIGS